MSESEGAALHKIFSSWAGMASHYIGECFDKAKPFIDQDFDGLDPYVRFVSAQLFIDCHLTSESVLILVQEGKEWDADLLARSVMEGSVKYVFMMSGSPDETKSKAVEYWEILPLFAAVKRSVRAKCFLDSISNSNATEWRPIRDLILPAEKADAVTSKYGRKERQALTKKWSFSGIARHFLDTDNNELKRLVHLAHGYAMSSHLIHKDGDGVGMVWDRYRRDTGRQTAVKLGHSGRIVSDICILGKLRLLYLLRASKGDLGCVKQLDEKYHVLFEQLSRAGAHFNKVEYPESSAVGTQ